MAQSRECEVVLFNELIHECAVSRPSPPENLVTIIPCLGREIPQFAELAELVFGDQGSSSVRAISMPSSCILDVEDEDQKQERIKSLLEKLNSTGKKGAEAVPLDFLSRNTEPINPPEELLSRVQAFLPKLKESNDSLAQRLEADPSSLNIECIEETDTQVIEMDLGLGVFEDRSRTEDSNSTPDDDSDSDAMSTSSESSDTSDSSSSSSQTENSAGIPASRPKKPMPRRTRPEIVVLD